MLAAVFLVVVSLALALICVQHNMVPSETRAGSSYLWCCIEL